MNDKKSKKGIIGITLAAIMIASIFAVFPLPVLSDGIPGKECEAQPGELIVDIVTPNATYNTFEPCTHFYVDAAIANSNDFNLDGVNVTINIAGNAKLATTDETYTKYVGQILSHEVTDVWWELHCTDPGDVTITVTANTTTAGVANGTDYVEITQYEPPVDPVLIIDIFQYPTETLEESDESGIKATITNVGDITAENVTAWINLIGNANLVGGIPDNWSVGDIAPGEVEEVGWTMHCNGSGDVTVWVNATATNLDNVTQIQNDSVIVHQETPADLRLWITEPDNGDKICTNCEYDEFVVNAIIVNKGGVGAEGITAHIGTDSGDSHVDIEVPYTRTVPDLGPGESATVSWNVTCNDTGKTVFNVTALGYDVKDGHEMEPWDTAYIYQQDFIVDIYEPSSGEQYSSCQNFEVKARLQNCKDEVISGINITYDFRGLGANFSGTPKVWVTHKPKPDWDDSYPMTKLADGLYNVTITDSFCPCCWANLTWYMECLDNTSGEIIVNVTQVDGDFADEDSVWINQEWKADLAAGIETFAGVLDMTDPINDTFVTTASDAIPVGQNFTLVVPVTNWGDANAEDVSVSIDVDGPATPGGTLTKNLGTIRGGETNKAIWTMQCTGKGTVTFEIPTGGLTGNDENTGESVLSNNIHIPCPKTIKQIPFTATILEPVTCTNFTVGDYFTVKANVSNDDPDITLKNVKATLYWTTDSNITNVTGQPLTMPIGNLKPGKYSKVTWQMQCIGPGEVYMWVKVTSTEPEFTIYSDTVNVHQKTPADVTVKILSPGECTFIPTCTEFLVTATLKDELGCLDAIITNATVNIYPADSATVVSGPEPGVPIVLVSGEPKVVTWTLHCDKSIDLDPCAGTEIEVNVSGKDSTGKTFGLYGEINDTTEVYQYPAAHLEVDISAPDDGSKQALGSDFWVNATITNTGEADVWEGQATLSVVPENSLLLAEGGYTQDLGSLVGHGEDGSAPVSWKVQCEELGKSTITVDVSGKDEFGYHLKQQPSSNSRSCPSLDCEYEPELEPGRAIPEDHIEPKSITVKQVTEEDLVEPFDDNITIVGAGWTFMSVPKKLVPAQDTFGELLDGTLLVAGFRYDPATPPYWFSLTGSDPVEVLEGYWIYYSSADTITLSYLTGGQMVPPSKDLTGKAWNAIGFSSTAARSASTTLKSVEGSWSTVIGWDEIGEQYESAIIYEVNDEALMYPGKGYWDWMTADDTLSALSA